MAYQRYLFQSPWNFAVADKQDFGHGTLSFFNDYESIVP